MLELAIKSRIPVIGVQTDDLPNFEAVLANLTKLKVIHLDKKLPVHLATGIYWTEDLSLVTTETYVKFMDAGKQLIVLNPDKKSPLIFDAGILPTVPSMVHDYLKQVIPVDQIEPTMKVLKGLSLKSIGEIVMMTQARTGATSLSELRRTRAMFGGSVQGLYPVDTDYDFYQMPEQIQSWLDLNHDYFMGEHIPPKLRPRGIMLNGTPGLGKSMAAKAIANHFDVPLYRLDIATTMNRYIGESEARVARSLTLLEKESPCVLLLDEVEKVFSDTDDGGVTARILGQLLWWLSDHQSQIITVMTTNDLKAIPPELYRQGRIDFVLTLQRMQYEESFKFAVQVMKSILGVAPNTQQYKVIGETLAGKPDFSHAEVAEMMYTCIKQHHWYKNGK